MHLTGEVIHKLQAPWQKRCDRNITIDIQDKHNKTPPIATTISGLCRGVIHYTFTMDYLPHATANGAPRLQQQSRHAHSRLGGDDPAAEKHNELGKIFVKTLRRESLSASDDFDYKGDNTTKNDFEASMQQSLRRWKSSDLNDSSGLVTTRTKPRKIVGGSSSRSMDAPPPHDNQSRLDSKEEVSSTQRSTRLTQRSKSADESSFESGTMTSRLQAHESFRETPTRGVRASPSRRIRRQVSSDSFYCNATSIAVPKQIPREQRKAFVMKGQSVRGFASLLSPEPSTPKHDAEKDEDECEPTVQDLRNAFAMRGPPVAQRAGSNDSLYEPATPNAELP